MSDPETPVDWHNIHAVQDEITRWANEQFPGRTDHQTIYKLVVHEIPELMIHKKERGTEEIGTELADAFILLMDLASMWEVDLVQAIRAKMEVNYGRVWERDPHGVYQHVPHLLSPPPDTKYDCPHCLAPTVTRELTAEERIEANVQWGSSGVCPFDSVCLSCKGMFDSTCPF